MESSNKNTAQENPCPSPHTLHHHFPLHHRPHPHPHHHFFYISPHCPLHRSILQPQNHSPSCSSFPTSHQPFPPNRNPEDVSSVPPDTHLSLSDLHPNEAFSYPLVMQDEFEQLEVEEEEEPIFVLTDEWRDFFAKSEAKRRLEKKQGKKKGKN